MTDEKQSNRRTFFMPSADKCETFLRSKKAKQSFEFTAISKRLLQSAKIKERCGYTVAAGRQGRKYSKETFYSSGLKLDMVFVNV